MKSVFISIRFFFLHWYIFFVFLASSSPERITIEYKFHNHSFFLVFAHPISPPIVRFPSVVSFLKLNILRSPTFGMPRVPSWQSPRPSGHKNFLFCGRRLWCFVFNCYRFLSFKILFFSETVVIFVLRSSEGKGRSWGEFSLRTRTPKGDAGLCDINSTLIFEIGSIQD